MRSPGSISPADRPVAPARMTLTLSSLPRLLQLCSPSLPVGAYAYSQGLECAVERGWVRDEASAGDWILGLLNHGLRNLDLPVLARLYRAWRAADPNAARRWNAWLYASREAAELQREDHHLGTALARLLTDLGIAEASTVGTGGRHGIGMEHVAEDVRGFDADPAQAVHLESPRLDVAEKRPPIVTAQIDFNTRLAELALDNGRQTDAEWIAGGLVDQLQRMLGAVTRLTQQGFGLG